MHTFTPKKYEIVPLKVEVAYKTDVLIYVNKCYNKKVSDYRLFVRFFTYIF